MSRDLERRIARIEYRLANMSPPGRVVERDHEKGVRVNLGTDEKPFLSPWIQPGDRTGASRYLPEVGEQVRLDAYGGDWTQARVVPFTHSTARPNPAEDADETVHHNRDGERRSVKKGHARHQAKGKISQAAGDGGKKAEGSGKSGANLPHEINRQLQGIRANLTQHTQDIGGLHKATSQFRDIVQKVIPAVQAVQPLLDGDPQSLGKASELAQGNLESYVAKAFQQMVGKLANGFMANAAGLVQGFVSGEIGGLLDQVEALGAGAGIGEGIAPDLQAARALAGSAAGGGAQAQMGARLDAMGAAFAGTSAEAGFAAVKAQMGGLLGRATDIAANLSGAVDAQQNLVKGMSKSLRLGGYEGEE